MNGRPSDSEAVPTFAAPTLDNRPAGPGTHPRAETVDLVAATHVRLIGAFHENQSEVGVWLEQVTEGVTQLKPARETFQ
jgi:hypothetical protein